MAKDKTPPPDKPVKQIARRDDDKKPTNPRVDRRGTPPGKATRSGGPGKGGKAPKGRIGNPPFKPTKAQRRRVVELVAGSPHFRGGAPQWFIARDLSISEDTLQRHFREELDTGTDQALALIGASMMGRALDGDHDAQKYVLARRGNWKTTTAVEQSGPDGGPIRYTAEPARRDLSHLSEDELLEYERLTAKLEASERASDE
jgi:hypothetical protein